MSKSAKTKELEECLFKNCTQKRIYGCEEVTIGFQKSGNGNERCDFVSMDYNGIFRCYELKVSIEDFRSQAKLSFYGHYNYLMVPKNLYFRHQDELEQKIPSDVGICTMAEYTWGNPIEIIRKAKKRELSADELTLISQSMIRSMGLKYLKARKPSGMQIRDNHIESDALDAFFTESIP